MQELEAFKVGPMRQWCVNREVRNLSEDINYTPSTPPTLNVMHVVLSLQVRNLTEDINYTNNS